MKLKEGNTIKIITCNVPTAYLNAIDKLVTNDSQGGLFPSRSELIRVAVREFLLKELEIANEFEQISIGPNRQNMQVDNAKEVKREVFLKKVITP